MALAGFLSTLWCDVLLVMGPNLGQVHGWFPVPFWASRHSIQPITATQTPDPCRGGPSGHRPPLFVFFGTSKRGVRFNRSRQFRKLLKGTSHGCR